MNDDDLMAILALVTHNAMTYIAENVDVIEGFDKLTDLKIELTGPILDGVPPVAAARNVASGAFAGEIERMRKKKKSPIDIARDQTNYN